MFKIFNFVKRRVASNDSQLSHLSHPKYRPDIDGLRAIAVLAVVLFHAFPNWVKGGFIGVDVFFVISGFLITTIIFESLDKGTFSFVEFYARRIRRIFPALLIVLITCLVFGWFSLLADEYKQLGKHIAAGVAFISNFIFWHEAGYFDNSAETKPLLHLWSLGIEEQFYIIWPLMLWLASKRQFNLLYVTLLASVVSFFLNIKGVKIDAVATFYSPQSRFWELLSGSLLAWFGIYKPDFCRSARLKVDRYLNVIIYRQAHSNNGKTFANVLAVIGLLLLAYGFWRINKDSRFPGGWALVPVFGAMLLISAGSKAWVNQNVLSNKFAIWFGLISFPLYLWHWPILSFARIYEGEVPSRRIRVAALVLSVMLAWLTAKLIEKPFRSGNQRIGLKLATLCCMAIAIGLSGFVVSKLSLSQTQEYEKLAIKRKGFEHAFGPSLSFIKGKEDWLFLGNQYDNTVAKLKLAIVPSDSEIESTKEIFSNIAEAGAQNNTKIVLIVGPNKSSIYLEYLPDQLVPSTKKYSSLFLEKIKEINNLVVYDPTDYFVASKKSEGILYWRTDTHWNNKGAFLAYSGFSKLLSLPVPQVEFKHGTIYSGDLIGISKLKDFPLNEKDNWDVVWENKPTWSENEVPDEQKTSFGSATVVSNQKPLSTKHVWVVGDSFTNALRQYLNATFKDVRYVGHWGEKLKDLPADLAKADKKPDMVIIVRVERSF